MNFKKLTLARVLTVIALFALPAAAVADTGCPCGTSCPCSGCPCGGGK